MAPNREVMSEEENERSQSCSLGCITDVLWKSCNLRRALKAAPQSRGNGSRIGCPWRLGWFLQSVSASDEA